MKQIDGCWVLSGFCVGPQLYSMQMLWITKKTNFNGHSLLARLWMEGSFEFALARNRITATTQQRIRKTSTPHNQQSWQNQFSNLTKLCAKFGCSRTPRTASAHKSFIVLRCMWKEPAPLRTYLGENSSPNMGNRRICPQIWSQISPQIWWIPKFGEKFVPKKPGNIYACMGSSSQGLQIWCKNRFRYT